MDPSATFFFANFSFSRRIDSLEGLKPPILERYLPLTFAGLPTKPEWAENTCHQTRNEIRTGDSSTREGARSHTRFLCTFV